jgi:hypothetical protein
MLLVRPLLAQHFLPKHGRMSIYAALYFFPTLALIHAVFGGLICEYNLLNLILHIYEYRISLLFTGVMFLKTPVNGKTAMHDVKTSWEKWD